MSKDLEIKWGFIDKDNNLVETPKNIKEHIEAREKHWFDKIKEIDKKCGILLEKLALTEKALELACNKIGDMFGSNYQEAWFFADVGNSIITREYFEEYFKIKAKEMVKSE